MFEIRNAKNLYKKLTKMLHNHTRFLSDNPPSLIHKPFFQFGKREERKQNRQ